MAYSIESDANSIHNLASHIFPVKSTAGSRDHVLAPGMMTYSVLQIHSLGSQSAQPVYVCTCTTSCMVNDDTAKKESKVVSGFMKVHYHNKGIEMLNLPKILHSKAVRDAVPPFLNKEPPMVSYTYTKTISG